MSTDTLRFSTSTITRGWGRAAMALAAFALLAGCGKDPNIDEPNLLEFPNVLPERPEAMSAPDYEPWTSGRALAVSGDEIFALDAYNGDLVVLERSGMTVVRSIPVGERPGQVAVAPDGTAFVTVRGSGELVRVPAGASAVDARAFVGNDPVGVAVSHSGAPVQSVFVAMATDHQVASLDPQTLAERARADVLDTPRALAAQTATKLTVVHQHAGTLTLTINADGTFGSAASAELRRRTPADAKHDPSRADQVTATRAIAAAVHPGNGSVLVAHVAAQPGDAEQFAQDAELMADPSAAEPEAAPASSSGYGSTARTSTFDIPQRPVETTVTAIGKEGEALPVLASDPVQDLESSEPMTHRIEQPSDINHHPTHTLALVTGEGTDSVLVLNTNAIDPMLSPLAEIKVGWAPKAVAFSEDGAYAYVLNSQQFTISEIAMAPLLNTPVIRDNPNAPKASSTQDSFDMGMAAPMEESQFVSEYARSANTTLPMRLGAERTVKFADDPRSPAVKRGQRVFTYSRNERMSHAGTFACATCHFEGQEDKLVWVIGDGPRQTPALAGRLHDTAPFNWAGTKQELEGNMVQTVARMGGLGLSDDELGDLKAFLLSLPAKENPNVSDDGQLSEMQAWGKEIFYRPDVGCGTCHSGQAFTDGANHDVGTASDAEVRAWSAMRSAGMTDAASPAILNTPTLRGLFHTAPYLHDGSAPTLRDVLDADAPEMGHPDTLTSEEKDALVAFLLTL